MSDWTVELVEDNISEFHVHFKGPADSERRRLPCLPALPARQPAEPGTHTPPRRFFKPTSQLFQP
jgi:hypothetical protein